MSEFAFPELSGLRGGVRRASGGVRHLGGALRSSLAWTRRRLVTFPGLVGAAVVLLAVLLLAGQRIGPPSVAGETPLAGVGLLLLGASLFLLSDDTAGTVPRRLGQSLAGLAALVGALTLVEYLYGADLGIAQALGAVSGQTGRLAPSDALDLLLCGLALVLVNTETQRGRRPAELFALVVAAIALPTAVSFLYGALPRPDTKTCLHIAITFTLLAAGVLFVRPRRGVVAVMTGPGISGVAARRLLPLLVVVPLVLGRLFVALGERGVLARGWIAPLFASSVAALLLAIGVVSTLSMHRSDADRSRTERRLQAQHAATRALTEYKTVAEAIPVILSSFAESLGWDMGALWKVDPEARVLRCTETWHRPGLDVSSFTARTRALSFQRGVNTPGRVWMTGEPGWVPDLARFPNFRAVEAERHGLHAAFAFPIRYLDQVTGVMEFLSRDVRQPEPDIVAMASVLGSQVGDAIERKRAEEQLRASEDRFRAVAESAPDALVSFDASGGTTYLNPAAERLFRYGHEDALGRPISELLPIVRPGVHPGPNPGAPRSGTTLESSARRANGTEFPAEISLAAWHTADGAEYRTAIVRDMSARKAGEDALRRTRDAAETAARELEAFSYSVSHDLRGPLRSIEGFTRAVLDDFGEHMEERARDDLGRVCSAAQRMSQLIDDLLALSRTSRAPLHVERVNLSAIAREVSADLRRRQPDRAADFLIEDGMVVAGDPTLLRAVVENLLDNAWKFTARNPRTHIEFGALRQVEGRPVYFVRDDGAGFDPAGAEQLFQPFRRLHRASEFPGTGIGLATVQRVVQRHGGRIWAESAVGQGATFYFTLAAPVGEPGEGGLA